MYRVRNVNSNELLSEGFETFKEALAAAEESESHETQPEVVIEKFSKGEWVETRFEAK